MAVVVENIQDISSVQIRDQLEQSKMAPLVWTNHVKFGVPYRSLATNESLKTQLLELDLPHHVVCHLLSYPRVYTSDDVALIVHGTDYKISQAMAKKIAQILSRPT